MQNGMQNDMQRKEVKGLGKPHRKPNHKPQRKPIRKPIRKPHPWTKEEEALLGTALDTSIAEQLNLPYHVVFHHRTMLGITAWRTLRAKDKKEQTPKREKRKTPTLLEPYRSQLGQVPDAEIARQLNVSPKTIGRWRRAQKIPAYEGTGAKVKRWTSESEKLLGTMPDRKLAKKLGIPLGTVLSRRLTLRIAPYAKWIKGRPGRTCIDGQKVRARRLELGLSYNQASNFNKTRKGHLAKIESGAIATVMPETVKWLCEALQCEQEEILREE